MVGEQLSEFELMYKKISYIIFNISLNAQEKNNQDLKEEIGNAIYILTKIFIILDKIVNNKNQSKISDKAFAAQMLLWQSSNALIGSLQLIRQGYTLEPLVIMRHSIEYLSIALSFYGKDGSQYYNKFVTQRLSGEKCINAAKKLVSSIGQIYGSLSEIAHPSNKLLGYYYMENRGSLGTLMIGGGVTDDTQHRVKMNLAILNFILWIHWESAELMFVKYLPTTDILEQIDKNTLKRKLNKKHKYIYKKITEMLLEALSESKINEKI